MALIESEIWQQALALLLAAGGAERRPEERVWRVVPARPPTVCRHCTTCNGRSSFVSSGKFRLNGQHHRLDAWLVYKCAVCERTWHSTLFTRRPAAGLDPDLRRRLADNDPDTALAFACDTALLRRNGAEWEACDEYVVEGEKALPSYGVLRLTIVADGPTGLRLDALLARQWGLSRAQVQRACRKGRLRFGGKPSQKINAALCVEVDCPLDG